MMKGIALVQPGASFSVGTVVSCLTDFITSGSQFSVFAGALPSARRSAFKAFPLTVKPSALTQLSGTVGPTETGRSGDGWLLLSLGLQLGVGA